MTPISDLTIMIIFSMRTRLVGVAQAMRHVWQRCRTCRRIGSLVVAFLVASLDMQV